MNRAQKFGLILMAVSVITPAVLDYATHKYNMLRTKPVDPALQKEIAADRFAKAIVLESIHNGAGYQNRRLDPSEDFEFHRIAYHFNN